MRVLENPQAKRNPGGFSVVQCVAYSVVTLELYNVSCRRAVISIPHETGLESKNPRGEAKMCDDL